jgi:hypothetical protein
MHARFNAGLILGVAACAAIAGCDAPGCEPNDEPTLEIGKGLSEFTALDEGGRELELIHGTQGGFHTDIALQATGLDGSDAATARIIGTLDGDELAETRPYVDLRCNPRANAQQAWALRLIWDSTPEELDGAVVSIELEITDVSGTTLSVVATDVLIEDPNL